MLVHPDLKHFHYPFREGAGSFPEYIHGVVREYVGRRVLDLGCGTGWLREAWGIEDYTGVEPNGFELPFQSAARETQRRSGVLNMDAGSFFRRVDRPYDTVIAYESFHEFPAEFLEGVRGPALREGGTAIVVDAERWWSDDLCLTGNGLERVLRHEVPADLFDLRQLATVSLDIVEALERAGVTRAEVVEHAEYNMQPEILGPLKEGARVAEVRRAVDGMDLQPPDLAYTVNVLRKTC